MFEIGFKPKKSALPAPVIGIICSEKAGALNKFADDLRGVE